MLAFLSPLLALLNPFLPALQGALPALGGFLVGFAGSVKQYWKLYLIALLALLFAGTTYEWRHVDAELKTEKAAHAADIKSYKDAQAEAQKKADAEKTALTKQAKDKAHAADKSYTSLLASYRANLLRYQAIKSAGSGPRSGVTPDPTQGSDGPSSGANLPATVTITGEDANTCAINTARLKAAHDWAITLGKPDVQTN